MTFVPGIGETGPVMGPFALGYMFGCILVGILIMQVYSYYNDFPHDRAWTKWMVGVLLGLELIFTFFTFINAWAKFGPGWGDIHSLEYSHWSLVPMAPLNGTIVSIVQFFFAYRIYKLTNTVWIPTIIVAISVLQCGMIFYIGIANAMRGLSFATFADFSKFITIWLVTDAVCDIIITISTVTILVRASRRSRFRNTKTTLRRLIRLSVETGLITASGATAEWILWQTRDKSINYYFIFFFALGKVYSNALMAALNSRAHIRSETAIDNLSTNMGLKTWIYPTLFDDEYTENETSGRRVDPSVSPFRDTVLKSFQRSTPMDSKSQRTSDTLHRVGPSSPISLPQFRLQETFPHTTVDSDDISDASSPCHATQSDLASPRRSIDIDINKIA